MKIENMEQKKTSYEHLKELILEYRIERHHRFTEAQLAEILNTSRIPVREAVQKLLLEGYMERHEKSGYRITEFSPQDVIDIYNYREALDGMLTRLFTERMDATQLFCLETNLKSMEEALNVPGESFDQTRFSRMDQEFHRIIARGAHNRLMEQQHELILEKIIYIAGRNHRDFKDSREDLINYESFKDSYHQHKEIFEAVRKRDPDGAERLARLSVRNGLKKNLKIMYGQY